MIRRALRRHTYVDTLADIRRDCSHVVIGALASLGALHVIAQYV